MHSPKVYKSMICVENQNHSKQYVTNGRAVHKRKITYIKSISCEKPTYCETIIQSQ